MAQVIWNRHDLHRRHARPACVPDGNPDARKKKRCQHARHLTKNFPEIALLDTYAKHEPMRVGVLHRAALAEDMRALKMIEAFGIVAVLESRLRERNFRGVCGGDQLVHDGKIVVDLRNHIRSPLRTVNFSLADDRVGPNRIFGARNRRSALTAGESLDMPAMTIVFQVKEPAMLDDRRRLHRHSDRARAITSERRALAKRSSRSAVIPTVAFL